METKPRVVLAIDIGTSSTRSALYNERGERIISTTAQFSYSLQAGADGRAELRPADLKAAVFRVVATTLRLDAESARDRSIQGIGVSCFWHSMLGLDAKGTAITPIYTWADSRCRAAAAALRKGKAEFALHRRTGCMARTSFWPARLLWLRKTEPRLFRRVARWVSPAEWIQEEMCGQASISLSMASGTGLLDACTLRWDPDLLQRCGISITQLNPLSEEPSVLSARGSKKWPQLKEAKWFPALGDGAASNLGSEAILPGVAAINVGTSAALRVVMADDAKARRVPGFAPAPPGLFGYRVDARRRLVGGAVSNAGNLRAWALRELKLADEAALEKALAGRPLPVRDLTVLPFWTAERAPTWPENLPSAVLGMNQATTALDLLQALMEATYQRLALIAGEVERSAGRRLSFVVSGGISHSVGALQRLADVLGRPVRASHEPEASLRGAALFAWEHLGVRTRSSVPGRLIRPRPAAARAHAVVRQRLQALEILLQKT